MSDPTLIQVAVEADDVLTVKCTNDTLTTTVTSGDTVTVNTDEADDTLVATFTPSDNVIAKSVEDGLTASVLEDEVVANYEEVDDTLTVTISSGDTLIAKATSVYAAISRGIGYVWAGAYNIIQDVIFRRYRKTKAGNQRVTKSGAKRIISREIQ